MSIKTHRFGMSRFLGRDAPQHQLIIRSRLRSNRLFPSFFWALAAVFSFLILIPGFSEGHITEENRSLLGTSPTGQTVYTVESGDSLWKIFQSLEKEPSHWPVFLAENRHFPNPDQIFPGEKVIIPWDWLSPIPPGKEVLPVLPGKAPEPAVSRPVPPEPVSSQPAVRQGALKPAEALVPSEPSPSAPPAGSTGPIVGWEISLIAVLFLFVLWLLSQFYSRAVSRVRWVVVTFTVALGVRYLFWRITETLNTASMLTTVLSWVLLAAEIYGFLSVLFFYVQVAKPTRREAPPLNPDNIPSVDIFVTTYNESTDILFRTLVACRGLDYPKDRKTVYVLDDGGRPEVRRLAERLNCRYLARPSRKDAKAGNLNFGLEHSGSELVLALDCDHVPVRSFLKETVGFFYDRDIAFVQTPHYFYNPDTFQRNLRLEDRLVNEQDLFFRIIQEGRDGFNCSFFAGSGGIFRRSPLESVGGFQTKTLTEDLHTSMVLHSRGARSVYLNKVLAAGLAPESYGSYLRQRQRWAKGGFQVFFLDNPLLRSGLSLMQRIQYFGAIFYFFQGLSRVVYLTAPLAFLLFAIPPLQADWKTLLSNFVPYYFGSLMAFNLFSRGFRNPFWSDLYETAMAFSVSGTFFETLIHPRESKFHVTPKGRHFDRGWLDWSSVLPHACLLLLIIGGFVVGGMRLLESDTAPDPYIISGFWAAYNVLLLGVAMVVARERSQKRISPRLLRKIPCQLTSRGEAWDGVTTNISETGIGMSFEQPVSLPPIVDVRLKSDFGEETRVKGEIIRNDRPSGGLSSVGIRFLGVSDAVHQSLVRQMYSSPSSWKDLEGSPLKTWGSLGFLAISFLRVFIKDQTLRRFSERFRVELSCVILSEGEAGPVVWGTTEDIGNFGMSARVSSAVPLGDKVSVRIYHKERVLFSALGDVTRIKKSRKNNWVCGIRFLQAQQLDPSIFPKKG